MNTLEQQCFDGIMLSDGNVSYPAVASPTRNPRFQQTSKHREFLEWVEISTGLELRYSGPMDAYLKQTGRTYQYHIARSRCREDLRGERERWYPGNARKIVPPDFKVTPTSMMAAYLGDGSTGRTSPSLILAMYGYTWLEVDRHLVEPLRAIGFSVGHYACKTQGRGGGQIGFARASMQDFLDWIGPCPVRSYDYKWQICPTWGKKRKRTEDVRA